MGVIGEIIKQNPTLPDSPDFPNLPDNHEHAVNLMITLINQANYLIDKLVASLKERHMKLGSANRRTVSEKKGISRLLICG